MRPFVSLVLLLCVGLTACQARDLPARAQPAEVEPYREERLRGEAEARERIAAGSFALLVPSAVPIRWRHEIHVEEYARYGIDYVLTGDAFNPVFEVYRGGFNRTMERAIREAHGGDVFERIQREIDRRLVEEEPASPG